MIWLSSLGAAIGRIAAPSRWSAPSLQQAIAAIGEEAITAREIKTAGTGLNAFDIGSVEATVSKKLGNLPDDEAGASDVLGFLAGIGVPGAFKIEAIVKLLEILIPFVVASQSVHPTNDPVRDAQTREAAAHRSGALRKLHRNRRRTNAPEERCAAVSGPIPSHVRHWKTNEITRR